MGDVSQVATYTDEQCLALEPFRAMNCDVDSERV